MTPKRPVLPKPKHPLGYTGDELKSLCRKVNVKWRDFNKAFGVNTCVMDEKTGEVIYYLSDVERTLAVCLGYREVSGYEFD